MTTDLLVIGGGIVGRITAFELAKAGARVILVDAAQNAGSTANAGSLHVQMQSRFIRIYPEHAPNVERALPYYKQAVECWGTLEACLGDMHLVRKGGLMLAESAGQMAFLEEKARREETKGLDVALLDRAELDRVAPWIGPQIVGAELCRDEGKLNPLLANMQLAKACADLSVTCVTDRVEGLVVTADRVSAAGQKGHYRASEVVVAASWGSGALVRTLGIDIPTAPEPLHMNITEACDQRIDHLVQHAERSITLKQFKTGQIVIGGGWPADDHGTDQVPGVRAGSIVGNVALAARLAPPIGALRIIRTWAGMNTTADGASIIGRLPGVQRVVMAVPGDAGYTLAPLVAQMAASIVTGRDPPADPSPYSPARFAA